MTWNFIEGRWYQLIGGLRVWLGTVAKNDLEVYVGQRDQLIGRIKEHTGVSFDEAAVMAERFESALHPEIEHKEELALI